MCCLFGLIDYGHTLTGREKGRMLHHLATAAEIRGTDATGIAYNSGGKLRIYKRPYPARYMRFKIPNDAYAIMGHTRMTTQGNEKFNFNNHPFPGHVPGTDFALAHNGVLYNDGTLRKQLKLPATRIQTDSYIAVQLLEQRSDLGMDSLTWMAEQLEGSFILSVLNQRDSLYIIRGDNPLCLVHFPELGLYLYASTEEILFKALEKIPLASDLPEEIVLTCGDILRIDRWGEMSKAAFVTTKVGSWRFYDELDWYPPVHLKQPTGGCTEGPYDPLYLDELKAVASTFGYAGESIDRLIRLGYRPEEIEEYLYCGEI